VLDPYAKALSGPLIASDLHYGFQLESPQQDLSFDRRDNASVMPKAVVAASTPLASDARKPSVSWGETIIYEAHVKGLTRLRHDIPPGLQGKFGALCAPSMI
jgi:glycogen operon protein